MGKSEQIQEIIERLTRCQRSTGLIEWQKFGLSHAQVGMLFMLSYHPEASVNQTANFLGVSKSAITQLVEPLSQKHLVVRSADSKDRRIIRLSLSVKGQKTIRELSKLKTAGLRSALQNLDSHELAQLLNIVSKLSVEGAVSD